MKFDARDNEYLGLHVLALQIQDMVGASNYDRNSPYVQLLKALDIDAVKLLAICKAASGKRGDAQLDFIKSQLAPAMGFKLRMGAGSVQALPHVSVFLRHFRQALLAVRERYGSGLDSTDLKAEMRRELAMAYPDPEAGLQAFDSAIKTFLQKTRHLPEESFMKLLKLAVQDSPPLQDEPPPALKTMNLDAAQWEADQLIEQLEKFRETTLRPAAATRQYLE